VKKKKNVLIKYCRSGKKEKTSPKEGETEGRRWARKLRKGGINQKVSMTTKNKGETLNLSSEGNAEVTNRGCSSAKLGRGGHEGAPS